MTFNQKFRGGREPHLQITEAFEGLTMNELEVCLKFHRDRLAAVEQARHA